MNRRRLIAVDWDGTCVYAPWSGTRAGQWQEGAVESLHELLFMGWGVTIFTERTTDEDPRYPVEEVRAMLDAAGLASVNIWRGRGKPPYHRLIDNRAIRYRGKWDEIIPLIGWAP